MYQRSGFESSVPHLQFILRQICSLIEIYPVIVALGGDVVPTLQAIINSKKSKILKSLTLELLYDIGQDTEKRLKSQAAQLLCPQCLVHCDIHKVDLPYLSSVTYYGCRACGQSREFTDSKHLWLITTLDNKLTKEEEEQQKKTIRIRHRKLLINYK